ncbi:PHP domain-containing protein [Gracilinema caldarium]|uniref:PHP domain-containing protein n=1 Tax=Gracilinema caldarium TaxID=215591 RepID=UPI0026F004CC|nr:PHP domain-containing protein [Gracilinema caldarium]
MFDIINDPNRTSHERLKALAHYVANQPGAQKTGEVNNHIHTIYSFSPYTPAMAALQAWRAGLEAAGSVDHDSLGAAEEMLLACEILGIGGCVGFEVRVSFKSGSDGKLSPFADRKINNPDSPGLVYMTVQGIPRHFYSKVHSFLEPLQEARNRRNRAMTEKINQKLSRAGFDPLSYETDIVNHSKAAEGGSITERHLMAAVAQRLITEYGKGSALAEALGSQFGIVIPPKLVPLLTNEANPHYLFDLLGLLKTDFLPEVFIQPGEDECIPAEKVVTFARSIGAIPAYAYLGDVADSPTGDKKAEHFEDAFLEELFAELKRIGYQAVTYMPPRNSREQLKRVQQLCFQYGFMEISGVDINSSRQSFHCPEVLEPDFRHLVDTTWALIAHERLASINLQYSLFHPDNPLAQLDLSDRIAAYAQVGRQIDPKHSETSCRKMIRQKVLEAYQNGKS